GVRGRHATLRIGREGRPGVAYAQAIEAQGDRPGEARVQQLRPDDLARIILSQQTRAEAVRTTTAVELNHDLPGERTDEPTTLPHHLADRGSARSGSCAPGRR